MSPAITKDVSYYRDSYVIMSGGWNTSDPTPPESSLTVDLSEEDLNDAGGTARRI